jgi:hypothetical protein
MKTKVWMLAMIWRDILKDIFGRSYRATGTPGTRKGSHIYK